MLKLNMILNLIVLKGQKIIVLVQKWSLNMIVLLQFVLNLLKHNPIGQSGMKMKMTTVMEILYSIIIIIFV